jgi:hypothetical protein
VSYAQVGSHSITASYTGDANFSGSSSLATTVTVSAPPVKKATTGRLLGPTGRVTVTRRTIRFAVRCQSKSLCRGRFSLTATVRRKHHKLTTVRCGTASFQIGANRSQTRRVALDGACLRLLRAQPHHRLTVAYSFQPQTGQVGERRRITLVLRSVAHRARTG